MKKSVLFLLSLVTLVFMAPQGSLAADQEVYTVQRGDSMWKISVRFEVGLSEIIAANPQVKNPSMIYPNQKLTIPLQSTTKSIEEEVFNLTNTERKKAGLAPFQRDWELQRTARFKSTEMRDKGYFSHTSPTYGSPFAMMKAFGISYRTAGENIAQGQRSAAEVVQAWMNSAGHRANILNPQFTHLGVGQADSARGPYWTQMFIGK